MLFWLLDVGLLSCSTWALLHVVHKGLRQAVHYMHGTRLEQLQQTRKGSPVPGLSLIA